ncbi:DNA adenine methylase [Thermus sp.]|uniref:DNA adenine methylase n=2 Tax=Thermus sp. TaxID=275 RepID=UPI003D0C8844
MTPKLLFAPSLSPDKGAREGLPPLLKWAGGKRWLLPYLRSLYRGHRHRRWVEPFAGGLAAALGLVPERALLNDLNPHLINFYRWVQRGLDPKLPMLPDKTTYYAYRERFNQLIREGKGDTQEAAELFYYLNRTGYNGLCRFNRKGEFNVPFGKYKRIVYQRDFSSHQRVFQNWEFTNVDFRQVAYQAGDFIYADPPYDVDFREYTPDGFSWQDQVELAQLLAGHPGPVVISNQATERVVRLYESLGFSLKFLSAPRRISCDGNRQRALEVLAFRNL